MTAGCDSSGGIMGCESSVRSRGAGRYARRGGSIAAWVFTAQRSYAFILACVTE